jgi:hypothetical protein
MMAGKGLTPGVADYQVFKSAITASDISCTLAALI